MALTLTVSSQRAGASPTIRDALEIATDGAVISIESGVYAEAVNLADRKVSLVAAGGAGAVTAGGRAGWGGGGEPGSVRVAAGAAAAPAVACRGGQVTLRGLVLKAGDYPAV